mgnify:CR=1
MEWLSAQIHTCPYLFDTLPAAMVMINQKGGSNASATINEIHEVLDGLGKDLPAGAEFVVLTDTNKFLYASIKSVIRTLLEAILLVVVVVYVFLQDIKSTLIPTISIFVSIIGTFAVMSLIGFSINLLTLFALVLAIGTVVDDAIVVVEAVQAKFDDGYRSPVLAADDAMKGVSSAILTSTIIFMAVFIPVAMMGGTSGAFYSQFGITMAVAVGYPPSMPSLFLRRCAPCCCGLTQMRTAIRRIISLHVSARHSMLCSTVSSAAMCAVCCISCTTEICCGVLSQGQSFCLWCSWGLLRPDLFLTRILARLWLA